MSGPSRDTTQLAETGHSRISELVRSEALMPGVSMSCTADLVHVRFAQPHRALSSAVLNGGFCDASDFLNARVAKHCPEAVEDPAQTLQRLSDELQCESMAVGMMTAASMKSLRVACESIHGESLCVLVTTGLDNARRAGDRAEYRSLDALPTKLGTINLGIVTSVQLADAALVEVVAVATEAKVAVMQELEIISPISGLLATGTGTDSIAVFSGHGRHRARFAGKHTLLGERLAALVMQVIRDSVTEQLALSR